MEVIGMPILIGIQEPKQLSGFPEGRTRIKMRGRSPITVYIKTETEIKGYYIYEIDGNWVPAWEIGRNIKQANGGR